MKREGFAIVTGGARGIGEGMCLQLASEGYKVVVNYVSEKSTPKAEAVVQKIKSDYKVEALAVRADVSDYSQCKKLIEKGITAFGEKIAVLVNNAGISMAKNFIEATVEDYTHLIGINLMGALHCTHLVLPYMVKQNYGCIVNISSIAGLTGHARIISYCTAKSGLIGMTKAMAKEFGQYKIRVNCIAPGNIMTDMLPKERYEVYKAQSPLGMIGEVKDISDCLSYIINAEFLTGQTISPNGGVVI